MNSSHAHRLQPRVDKEFWTSKKRGRITINISLSTQPSLWSPYNSFSLWRLLQEASPDVPLSAKHATECQGDSASSCRKLSCRGRDRVTHTVGEDWMSLATPTSLLPTSWAGLIDRWLTRPCCAQVDTVFQAVTVRKHVNRDFLKQRGAHLPHFPMSTEVLEGNANWTDIGQEHDKGFGVLCVIPDTPVSLSELRSPWFSVVMRSHIHVLSLSSYYTWVFRYWHSFSSFGSVLLCVYPSTSQTPSLLFGCDHSGCSMDTLAKEELALNVKEDGAWHP